MSADRSTIQSLDGEPAGPVSRGGWIVIACAILMGLPTLWGTFAFGDDHQLVLNHVLVNRPSLAHAIELFRIIHRDLYQPLPLLSFQIEFAIAGAFGLLDRGIEGGAWFFHMNNVLLHALNAFLVWALARRLAATLGLAKCEVVALAAGVLFAVHPLQVEVVAWINGRMMLLSTLGALATLWALSEWLRRGGVWRGMAVVFCALCCQISKVRVELPLLMVLILLAHRQRISPGVIGIWLCSAAITVAATLVNYHATDRAGMFEGAAQNLTGPGVVRALRSLAWYFEHFVVPVGLAPWYPAPGVVRWWEWETLRAVLTLLPVAALGVWSLLRHRPLCGGLAYFFMAVATTVQLVPTRNTLAADRYMYLPIVGLVWMVGIAAGRVSGMRKAVPGGGTPLTSGLAGMLVTVVLLAISWHTGWFYNEPLRKIMRIATLYPDSPHVWERAGWAYYHDGQYEKAIELATKDLRHDDLDVQSDALEVIGAAQLKLGRHEEALVSMQKAIAADPEKAGGYYRLATVLEEMGGRDEALALYEKSVGMAPLKNPWILRLASVYRERGRMDDARRMFEQALRNNLYDIPATLGLAELDMMEQTPEGFARAEGRLRELLAWEPRQAQARNYLAVVMNSTGRTEEAIALYGGVLGDDPANVTALLNLAAILAGRNDLLTARDLYLRAAGQALVLPEMLAIHDFLVATRDFETLVLFWERQGVSRPDHSGVREMGLFSRIIAGKLAGVPEALPAISEDSTTGEPSTRALFAFAALATGDSSGARAAVEALVGPGASEQAARRRLLAALEVFDESHPDEPWTFCLTARLLLAEGHREGADAFIGLCAQRCGDDGCQGYVADLQLLTEGGVSGGADTKKE